MGIFSNLLSAGGLLFNSAPDYSYGLIKQTGADKLLGDGRWDDFDRLVMDLGSEDLTRLLDGVCLGSTYANMINKYLLEGKSEVREIVAGAHNLYLAWERRGGNWGHTLSGEQVDGFTLHLQKAHDNFSYRFSTPVLEAESFARLIRVYMGFSDAEAAQSSFENASYLRPNHLLAHLNYFKVTTPKWLGDVNTMQAYVDQVEDVNLRKLLMLMLLVELYSDFDTEDTVTAKTNFTKEYSSLVEGGLLNDYDFNGDSLIVIYTKNYLSCLYRILGLSKKEAELNKQLIGRRTNYPWAYFGWK